MPASNNSAQEHNFYSDSLIDLAPDRNIGLLIKQSHFLMRRLIDTRVGHLGLTANQWQPLILIHYKNVDSPADLARIMQVDTAAITRTLDRLEQKGFLRRHKKDTDKRQIQIILTDAGAAISKQILPIIADSLNKQLKGFNADEISLLINMLHKMNCNIEQYLGQVQHASENAIKDP